jgi:hypothetical protein
MLERMREWYGFALGISGWDMAWWNRVAEESVL